MLSFCILIFFPPIILSFCMLIFVLQLIYFYLIFLIHFDGKVYVRRWAMLAFLYADQFSLNL